MRFLYLRNALGQRVGVVVTDLIKATTDGKGNFSGNIKTDMLQYSVSVCNPLDQFNASHGKALAAGRLALDQPKRYMPIDGDGKTKLHLLHIIAANRDLPQRAREAARTMLAREKAKATYIAAAQAEAYERNLDKAADEYLAEKRGPKPVDPPVAVGRPWVCFNGVLHQAGEACRTEECANKLAQGKVKLHTGPVPPSALAAAQPSVHTPDDHEMDRFHDEGNPNHSDSPVWKRDAANNKGVRP